MQTTASAGIIAPQNLQHFMLLIKIVYLCNHKKQRFHYVRKHENIYVNAYKYKLKYLQKHNTKNKALLEMSKA